MKLSKIKLLVELRYGQFYMIGNYILMLICTHTTTIKLGKSLFEQISLGAGWPFRHLLWGFIVREEQMEVVRSKELWVESDLSRQKRETKKSWGISDIQLQKFGRDKTLKTFAKMTWGSTASDTFCSLEDCSSEQELYFTAYTSFFHKVRRSVVRLWHNSSVLQAEKSCFHFVWLIILNHVFELIWLLFPFICSLSLSLHPKAHLWCEDKLSADMMWPICWTLPALIFF